MGKVLPPWCKRARKALIDKDMNFGDLTTTGYTREYVSALLNWQTIRRRSCKQDQRYSGY